MNDLVRRNSQGQITALDPCLEFFGRDVWDGYMFNAIPKDEQCIVQSIADTRGGTWPSRPDVICASPRAEKDERSDLVVVPEMQLFLADINLRHDGSFIFGKEASNMIEQRCSSTNKGDNQKGAAKKSPTDGEQAYKKWMAGSMRPSKTPLNADYVPARSMGRQNSSICSIEDFLSSRTIRVTFPEMILSCKDLIPSSQDTGLIIQGPPAKLLFSVVRLWIPAGHECIYDDSAMNSTLPESGLLLDSCGEVDVLGSLLARRNLLWIFDYNSEHVYIDYKCIEHIHNARMAHKAGVCLPELFTDTLSGLKKAPCCFNMFGGPSLHGKLEILVTLTNKAATRDFKGTEHVFFSGIFENCGGEMEVGSSPLNRAILALERVERKRLGRPNFTKYELMTRNIDVWNANFNIMEHLDKPIESRSMFEGGISVESVFKNPFIRGRKENKHIDPSQRTVSAPSPAKGENKADFELPKKGITWPNIDDMIRSKSLPFLYKKNRLSPTLAGPSLFNEELDETSPVFSAQSEQPSSSKHISKKPEAHAPVVSSSYMVNGRTRCCSLPMKMKENDLAQQQEHRREEASAKAVTKAKAEDQEKAARYSHWVNNLPDFARREKKDYACVGVGTCTSCRKWKVAMMKTRGENPEKPEDMNILPGEENGPNCILHRSGWRTYQRPSRQC